MVVKLLGNIKDFRLDRLREVGMKRRSIVRQSRTAICTETKFIDGSDL